LIMIGQLIPLVSTTRCQHHSQHPKGGGFKGQFDPL
jgi:hypothetical protein